MQTHPPPLISATETPKATIVAAFSRFSDAQFATSPKKTHGTDPLKQSVKVLSGVSLRQVLVKCLKVQRDNTHFQLG